jgi:hypothetical protein
MKTPFLIFLVSGLATLQLDPLASRGAELLSKVVRQQMRNHTVTSRAVPADDSRIHCLREELADVQLEMMKVLETDSTVTSRLKTREAELKYALRAEQVRRDEIAQCLKAAKMGASRLLAEARCDLPSGEKPQS